MHEDIVEHINRDAGYQAGFKAGMERAWNLTREVKLFYRDEIDIMESVSGEEKKRFERDIQAQVNALGYVQCVIQAGEF